MSLSRRALLRVGGSGLSATALMTPQLAGAHYRLGLGLFDAPNHANLARPSEVVHLLNRISFGITLEDYQEAQRIGWSRYLDIQLDYLRISDLEADQEISTYFPNSQLPKDLYFLHYNSRRSAAAHHARSVSLFRALLSKRQLFEVMVEFWNDHFNMYVSKDRNTRLHRLLDDRFVLRGESGQPEVHALGNFRALMQAAWKGSCMLHYLDGHANTKDRPNENYARELLELHTLGVDGGYDEHDVKEVARILSGWSVDQTEVVFDPDAHDTAGDKLIMGHVIASRSGAAGADEVTELIDFLVDHPMTRNFIATKLVKRFVADQPPAHLVDAVAETFQRTDGDIREMLRTIFHSGRDGREGFWTSQDAKIKRPFHYLLSCLRTLAAGVKHDGYNRYASLYLADAGHQPHGWDTPDGYPEEADFWLHPNDMRERLWLAFYLAKGADNSERGLYVDYLDLSDRANTPEELIENLRARILFRDLDPADYDALIDFATDGEPAAAQRAFGNTWMRKSKTIGVLGLMLSSRYFQLR